MGDVIDFAERANETSPFVAGLCRELKERVEANDERDGAMFWDAMEPINDGQGRHLPDIVMREDAIRKVPDIGWMIQLTYAIAALEMIASNTFDGGQPEDEPCFRQGFAARNLAAIALDYCLPRPWSEAHLTSNQHEGSI